MTQSPRESSRQRMSGNIGRARQRKLRREKELGVSSTTGGAPSRRRARSHNSLDQIGQSVRERLTGKNINVQTPTLKSIQNKLSSTFGTNHPQRNRVKTPKRSTLLDNVFAAHKPRRRAESRLVNHVPHLEVAQRTEIHRRNDPSPELHRRKGHKTSNAASAPPVMVRGGMGGMAFGRVASSRLQKRNTPKRRFDVALDVPGAELRLPSIPMIHLGWRALSGTMVVMMIACLVILWQAPVFKINAVEAEGLQRLTVGDLNTVMGIFGKSIFTVDPHQLEETLQHAFPELSTVTVNVNLPANVVIAVTERQPVIAWIQDGSEVWVDAEGYTFPPRGNPSTSLVRVEGHGIPPNATMSTGSSTLPGVPNSVQPGATSGTSSLRLPAALVSAILAMGAQMPTDTLLVYDDVHGLGWNDPNGWEVFFGTQGEDMNMKLAVYDALVQRLKDEGIQPALISVEYVHAPYYRMER